jgi:addiction module HigA family antidote
MVPSLAGYGADWASPPGDLIEEMLEEVGWTRAELAQRLDFSAKHVNELLKGRAPITADTAERLERVLGHDAGFWLRLEANYQQDLVRLQQLDELASQKDWLKELPLRWMQGEGWVDTCSHAGQQVSAWPAGCAAPRRKRPRSPAEPMKPRLSERRCRKIVPSAEKRIRRCLPRSCRPWPALPVWLWCSCRPHRGAG